MAKQTFEQYIKTETYSCITSFNKRYIGHKFKNIKEFTDELVKHHRYEFDSKSDALKIIAQYYDEFIKFNMIGALTFNALFYPNLAREYFDKVAIAYIVSPFIPEFPFVMTEDIFNNLKNLIQYKDITFDYSEVNKKFASSIITR